MALKEYSEQEIKQAITNYNEILKGNEFYFNYRWTLEDFIKRGLTKFLDLEVAKSNYLIDNNKKVKVKAPSKYGDGWR